MTKYHEMVKRHSEERKNIIGEGENFITLVILHVGEIKKAIEKDTTGENFIKDMFRYEMNNTEYHINQYKEGLLEYMSIRVDEFENSEALQKGFDLAEKKYMKNMEKYFYL